MAETEFKFRRPRKFTTRFLDELPVIYEAELYYMLKSLPIRITREELLQLLEDETDNLFQLFRTHDEPKEGYRVRGVYLCGARRQVCLFGLAECARAENVFCGPSMVFTNVLNPRSEIRRPLDEYLPTLVKECATIGANATILCGHTIGRYAFIGAGAVVTKDIPDYALVYGNAARIAGWMCECGEKLAFTGEETKRMELATCHKCGKRYQKEGLQVKRQSN